MATPTEKIAASLHVLRELQKGGRRVLKSEELSRVHRERLLKHGVLRQVMKGWLMPASQATERGETPPRHAPFWDFCALYCTDRFGSEWYLSPEQSILLQADATAVPERVVVYTPRGTNNTVALPFGTSIYDLKYRPMAAAADLAERAGVRLLTPACALLGVPESFFVRHAPAARAALASIRDASEVLGRLLAGGHSAVAGRLAGAFRQIDRPDITDAILGTMKAAGYDVRETDPFAPEHAPEDAGAHVAPIVGRMRALWGTMRDAVLETFPPPPAVRESREVYLGVLDDLYRRDAYHSLALEGYRVTAELIASGARDPAAHDEYRTDRDTLAARGYWQAFKSVQATVARILDGENAGAAVRAAHCAWHRELFQPFEAAQPAAPSTPDTVLADGVANQSAARVPPAWKAVRDAVSALFDLLESEPEASVRAVLGHWMFGYIHRYPDSDGRLARFVLNAMLASGGYPWAVIRVEDRSRYLAALESASIHGDSQPLARLIADRVHWPVPAQRERDE